MKNKRKISNQRMTGNQRTTNQKQITAIQKNKYKRRVKRKKISPKEMKKLARRKLFMDIVLTGLISMSILALVFLLTVQVVTVQGYDMTPTVNDADRLFVFKQGKIKRFSLVSFKTPNNQQMVERVIGLPGEEVEFREGQLWINNQEVSERFLSTLFTEYIKEPVIKDFHISELTGTLKIPENYYFILGDNRKYATDSRYFGMIEKKDIIGVVSARIFPFDTMRMF